MKKLIIVALLAITTSAFADPLATDSNRIVVQGFAPNGLYSALLTVNSTTVDMSTACKGKCVAFSVYAPADYKVRLMASSNKAGSISATHPGGQWTTLVVNKATPFVNISGATSGMIRKQ